MLQVLPVKSDQQIHSFLHLAQQQLNQPEVSVHNMTSSLCTTWHHTCLAGQMHSCTLMQHPYRQHSSHGSLLCRAMRETEALQKVPISIDTFDAEVASQAVAAGAHMVNDVSGGLMDPHMHAQVGFYCTSVLMHLHQ